MGSRLTSPKPKFWKKVQKIALAVAGIAALFLNVKTGLSPEALHIIDVIGIGATTVAGTSQLTQYEMPSTEKQD